MRGALIRLLAGLFEKKKSSRSLRASRSVAGLSTCALRWSDTFHYWILAISLDLPHADSTQRAVCDTMFCREAVIVSLIAVIVIY